MKPQFRIPYGNPDKNQGPLIALARRLNMLIAVTTGVGNGFPDVTWAVDGRMGLAEVKSTDGNLRPKQQDFRNEWKNGAGIVIPIWRTGADVVRTALNAPVPTKPVFGKAPIRRVIIEFEDGRREVVLPDGRTEKPYEPGPEEQPGTARNRIGREFATNR